MTFFQHLLLPLEGRLRDERAAAFVEYALLLALIVLVCLVAVSALGTTTSTFYSDTASAVDATG